MAGTGRRVWSALAGTITMTITLCACASAQEPAAFRDRSELNSCGRIVLQQGEQIPHESLDCLDAAVDTGAELEVTAPTIEGDPVTTYYRVGPGIGGLEIFEDIRQDGFGGGDWHHLICPDTISVSEPLGCRSATPPGP